MSTLSLKKKYLGVVHKWRHTIFDFPPPPIVTCFTTNDLLLYMQLPTGDAMGATLKSLKGLMEYVKLGLVNEVFHLSSEKWSLD